MELSLAERLASSIDPKGLTSLQNRNNDPAVAHAVAEQFGAYLMQGLMQNADGQAISMADGTGSGPVSAMFANAISRVAMSGDKLGLADQIYQSIVAKQDPKGTGQAAATDAASPSPAGSSVPAEPMPAAAPNTALHPQVKSFSLSAYRLGNGARPAGPPLGHVTLPPIPSSAPAAGAETPSAAKPSPTAGIPATNHAVALGSPAHPSSGEPAASATQNWAMKTLNLPRLGQVLVPGGDASIPSPPAAPPAGAENATGAGHAATAPARLLPMTALPSNYGLPWTHRNGVGGGLAPPLPIPAGDSAANQPVAIKDAEAFTETLAPALKQAAERLGVSPKILLAQAALETGWGHSVVGNNVFGVKAGASWQGNSVTARTHEMVGGHLVAQNSAFRSYPTTAQAVDDYVSLLSASGRYRSALGAGDNVAAYAQALSAGGYATDKDYAAKLTAIANSPKMAYATTMLEQPAPGQLAMAHG